LKLNELRPGRGARRKTRRVGRGDGSGRGKTSGRGSKGLFSRTGGRLRPGFEGGQMPLARRLPKRGFTNKFRSEYQVINVESLNIFKDGDIVNAALMQEKNLVRRRVPVKILGNGELKRKITVEAHKFSKSAADKVKNAGGEIKIIKDA